ncbi:hypothetical protein XELAEV_18026107mg [Xenopus laevis]|uniref:Uncharacterized protein n=1 Tax=Xenopus laevis TaxID=8355 RepID=A0A974CV55_XENLA|nr:hypothetical protein XELAEV_18026107mg [Xenopus laevis]
MATIHSAVLDLPSLASSHSLTAGRRCWKAARLDEELKCPHNIVSSSPVPGCFTCRHRPDTSRTLSSSSKEMILHQVSGIVHIPMALAPSRLPRSATKQRHSPSSESSSLYAAKVTSHGNSR